VIDLDEVTVLTDIDALIARMDAGGYAPTAKELESLRAEMVLAIGLYRDKPPAHPVVSALADLSQ
jgi:hypothetical protein